MSLHTSIRSKTLVVGLVLFGIAALFCCVPSCQAQDVDPDHFTATGVETFPERSTPTPAAKNRKKARPGSTAAQANPAKPVGRRPRVYRLQHKTNAARTSGK
jgi:hypothetical protein